MRKLFIFQTDKDPEYFAELECCFYLVKEEMETFSINLAILNIDYLISNKIEVVISNGISVEMYMICKGLKIVTITIDDNQQYSEFADIVIDYKSSDKTKYFTGPKYSVRAHDNTKKEIVEIIDLVKKLEWDSAFFNFPVAFVTSKHLTDNIVHHINKFIRDEKIFLVEYLCNCHDRNSVIIAEKCQFHFTDIRLTFEKKIENDLITDNKSEYYFGLADESHIAHLRIIASNLYKDSRYYFDGNFDIKKIDEFYQDWVEKAIRGTFDNECYCLYDHGIPAGFCTIKYHKEKTAQIGLFGISEKYQGRGFAKKLIDLVCGVLQKNDVRVVFVVTQGRNYIAQRIYQKTGFLIKSTELWYHKWR
jgi:dTDP-4-amino-4,6-dideoxy-D-galactose acyltransferase